MTTNNAETTLAGAELPTEAGLWFREGVPYLVASDITGSSLVWLRLSHDNRISSGRVNCHDALTGGWIKATPPTPPESRPLTISDDLPDLLFRKCRISQEDTLTLAEEIRAMVRHR